MEVSLKTFENEYEYEYSYSYEFENDKFTKF